MAKLSISQAWDESRAVLARDGKLIGTVALALVVLPTAILGAVIPGGLATALFAIAESSSPGLFALFLLVLLVILTGQLAITGLAIGPSVSVGEAIANGVRRLFTYVCVALTAGAILFTILVIAAAILGATVAPAMSEEEIARSPAVLLIVLILLVVYLFLLARVVGIAAAITTTERTGPIATIRRAWTLTSGNSWRLVGFFAVFILGTGVAVFAVNTVIASISQIFLGKIEPMSASALVTAIGGALASGAVTSLFAVMLARIYKQLAGAIAQAGVPSSGI